MNLATRAMEALLLIATLAVALLFLAGCQTLPAAVEAGARAHDGAVDAAETTLCRAISIGAWMRAYGGEPDKARAWRTLCEDRIKATPAVLP
jgi:starvation-inducible outer membrane lipoprotein